MGCSQRPGIVAQTLVAGDGTETAMFVPITDAVSLTNVTELETVSEVMGLSGAFSVQPAVKYSNERDKIDTGTYATIAEAQVAIGTKFARFVSLPGTPLRFAQFGYEVKNTDASGDVNKAMVQLRITFRLT